MFGIFVVFVLLSNIMWLVNLVLVYFVKIECYIWVIFVL